MIVHFHFFSLRTLGTNGVGANDDYEFEAVIATAGTTLTVTSIPSNGSVKMNKVLSAVGTVFLLSLSSLYLFHISSF